MYFILRLNSKLTVAPAGPGRPITPCDPCCPYGAIQKEKLLY